MLEPSDTALNFNHPLVCQGHSKNRKIKKKKPRDGAVGEERKTIYCNTTDQAERHKLPIHEVEEKEPPVGAWTIDVTMFVFWGPQVA
jgi:hypothetical protein